MDDGGGVARLFREGDSEVSDLVLDTELQQEFDAVSEGVDKVIIGIVE